MPYCLASTFSNYSSTIYSFTLLVFIADTTPSCHVSLPTLPDNLTLSFSALFKNPNWSDSVLSLAFLPTALSQTLEIEPSIILVKTPVSCTGIPDSEPYIQGFALWTIHLPHQVILQPCVCTISPCDPHHQFPPLTPGTASTLLSDNHLLNQKNHKALLSLLTNLSINLIYQ